MTVASELIEQSEEWRTKLQVLQKVFVGEWKKVRDEKHSAPVDELERKLLEELSVQLEGVDVQSMQQLSDPMKTAISEKIKRLMTTGNLDSFHSMYGKILKGLSNQLSRQVDAREISSKSGDSFVKETCFAAVSKLHDLQAKQVSHTSTANQNVKTIMSSLECLKEKYENFSLDSQVSIRKTIQQLEANESMQKFHTDQITNSLKTLSGLWNEQVELQKSLKTLLEKEASTTCSSGILSSAIKFTHATFRALSSSFFSQISSRNFEAYLWHMSATMYDMILHAQHKHKCLLSQMKASCSGFLVNLSHQIENTLWKRVRILNQQKQKRKLVETDRLFTSSEESPSAEEDECSRRIAEETRAINALEERHAHVMTREYQDKLFSS